HDQHRTSNGRTIVSENILKGLTLSVLIRLACTEANNTFGVNEVAAGVLKPKESFIDGQVVFGFDLLEHNEHPLLEHLRSICAKGSQLSEFITKSREYFKKPVEA